MRYYESLYIINPNLSEEEYKEVVDKFNNLVENNKGVIIKVDEWGKKTMAYRVKKFDKGSYVLLQFCGTGDIITKINRGFNLDDRVIKNQTVKLNDNVDPDALKPAEEKTEENVEKGMETESAPVKAATTEKIQED